jgi:hypothetical protein
MRLISAALAACLLAAPALAQDDRPVIEIRDALARVQIDVGGTDSVEVEVLPGDGRLPAPAIARHGGRVVVDGGVDDDDIVCRHVRGKLRWRPSGITRRFTGWAGRDALPKLMIRAPEGTALVIRDSGLDGTGGDFAAADLALDHCGKLTLGNLATAAAVDVSGNGTLTVGDVGSDPAAPLRIGRSGMGDLRTGTVVGAVEIDKSGMGDVRIAAVRGTVDSDQSGMGDVVIGGGRAEALTVAKSGMGDFVFRGVAVDPEVIGSGMGDVVIETYEGRLYGALSGMGDIRARKAG